MADESERLNMPISTADPKLLKPGGDRGAERLHQFPEIITEIG